MIIEERIIKKIDNICNNESLSDVCVKYYRFRPYSMDMLELVLDNIKTNNIKLNLDGFICLEHVNKYVNNIIQDKLSNEVGIKPKEALKELKPKVEEKTNKQFFVKKKPS
jgi:hypothetical protein